MVYIYIDMSDNMGLWSDLMIKFNGILTGIKGIITE